MQLIIKKWDRNLKRCYLWIPLLSVWYLYLSMSVALMIHVCLLLCVRQRTWRGEMTREWWKEEMDRMTLSFCLICNSSSLIHEMLYLDCRFLTTVFLWWYLHVRMMSHSRLDGFFFKYWKSCYKRPVVSYSQIFSSLSNKQLV
jgi:hypothetical protein